MDLLGREQSTEALVPGLAQAFREVLLVYSYTTAHSLATPLTLTPAPCQRKPSLVLPLFPPFSLPFLCCSGAFTASRHHSPAARRFRRRSSFVFCLSCFSVLFVAPFFWFLVLCSDRRRHATPLARSIEGGCEWQRRPGRGHTPAAGLVRHPSSRWGPALAQLLRRVHTAAHVSEAAAALQEIVADFVDLLNLRSHADTHSDLNPDAENAWGQKQQGEKPLEKVFSDVKRENRAETFQDGHQRDQEAAEEGEEERFATHGLGDVSLVDAAALIAVAAAALQVVVADLQRQHTHKCQSSEVFAVHAAAYSQRFPWVRMDTGVKRVGRAGWGRV